jgi:hypothetical protein
VKRLNNGLRCRSQETIEQLRAEDRFPFGAAVITELGPDPGEGDEPPIVVESKLNHILHGLGFGSGA